MLKENRLCIKFLLKHNHVQYKMSVISANPCAEFCVNFI